MLVGPCAYDSEEFQWLKPQSVTAILSLLTSEDEKELGITEAVEATRATVAVNDFDDLDLKRRLWACVAALDNLLKNGRKMYVHCTAGVTRPRLWGLFVLAVALAA